MGFLDLNGLSHYHTKITSYITTKLDVIKTLIPTKTSQLTNDSGYTNTTVAASATNGNILVNGTETVVYTLPNDISNLLVEAKTYTDTSIANLIDGTLPDTLNTLKEITDAIEDNKDLIEAIQSSMTDLPIISSTEIDTLFV